MKRQIDCGKEILLVTVVTVTYNAEEFLERTIKSVIEQDYPNIEYIIIDGGSNDGTIDIIKKYEKNINYWVSEPDKGIYDAMNKAILKASGKWINFMNAGDYFVDKHVVSLVTKKINFTASIICGDIIMTDEDHTNKKYRQSMGLNSIWETIPCWHQAMFISTALMKSNLYDTQLQIASDYDFMLKSYTQGVYFQFLDMPICYFLLGGINNQKALTTKIETLFVLSRYIKDESLIQNSVWYRSITQKSTIENRILFSNIFSKINTIINNVEINYKKIVLYGYGEFGKYVANKL
ncbi:MAG: glycosyltransferase family 2 protein, partial [Campylobacterota bacterium]|nr:glycosyltransferase family 2 protein [Campylobacterota bacterium]